MWSKGAASDQLRSAGVLVRMFDYSSDAARPWLNCDKTQCSYGDRLTGTIVNHQLPDVYNLWDSWNYGVVLSPTELKLRCSYSRDGFTFNLPGDGCPTETCDANCNAYYCRSTGEELWWKCGWKANQLKSMLTMHARLHAKSEFVIGGKMVTYNEVIIDTGAYFRGLPHSILAFLCTASASDEQRKAARKAHSSFLSKYSAAKGSTPLLVYDPSKSSQPFSLSE